MASTYQIGSEKFQVLRYVQLAIERLGYVKPESAEWLANKIAMYADRSNGRSIREIESLSIAERLSMGFLNYDERLNTEVISCLTERGLTDPAAHFDATCNFVVSVMRNEAQRNRHNRTNRPERPLFVLMGEPTSIGLCPTGCALAGKLLDGPPDLPLEGCSWEVCRCRWMSLDAKRVDLYRSQGRIRT